MLQPATSEYFYRNKSSKDGLTINCITCSKNTSRQYRNTNKGRNTIRVAEYKKAHPEKVQEWNKRYIQNKPDARVRASQKRIGLLKALPANFTLMDKYLALSYWDWHCAYCAKSQAEQQTVTWDHSIPLDDPNCAGTVASNMLPACPKCNRAKANNLPQKWIADKFGEDRAKSIMHKINEYIKWVNDRSDNGRP
jgi:hypothetical protein